MECLSGKEGELSEKQHSLISQPHNEGLSLLATLGGKIMTEIPMPEGPVGKPSDRPLGVAILAFLQILGGLAYIALGGLAVLAAGLAGIFGFILLFAGAVLLIVGIIGLIVGFGLWNMRSWAWLWAIIINILGIILSLPAPAANALGIVISIIIIVYLLTPDIKSRFR
jgi:lysylphosphatidylglycerol synthetase-like protein (DUF2156 family)